LTAEHLLFAGAKKKRPLNLANLARRVIVPKLRAAGVEWRGWHAFRRGLGTNLYGLGVPDKDIQAILRHANVNTTLTYYVKTAPVNSQVAMQKLECAFNLGIKSGIRRKKQKSLLTA
jgi:integrase